MDIVRLDFDLVSLFKHSIRDSSFKWVNSERMVVDQINMQFFWFE